MNPTPKPPTDTFRRVIHGGSWYYSTASVVRAAYRNDFTPSNRGNLIGFRLTQSGCRQQVLKVTP
jgi:formylglycine-generating enzyme required for sulfatase activity